MTTIKLNLIIQVSLGTICTHTQTHAHPLVNVVKSELHQ